MKIIIADDDQIVKLSLKTILESLEIEVLGTGGNGREAVELYKEHHPDVALLDIRMPVMTGLEAAGEILKYDSSAKILFLTTFSDDEYIIEALNMGVKGYILKQDFESISPALTAVKAGQSVFGRDVVSKLSSLVPGEKTDYRKLGISEKEEEVIALVAKGLNNKEIGQAMFLSEGTVRNYISGVLEKLQLRDRTQLAIFHHTH